MSSMSEYKRNLRERSEHYLRLAVLSELGRDQPSTVEPYKPTGGLFWNKVFVPLYRRVPWTAKEKAMGTLGMTAKGWKAPERKPGEPWRPPPGAFEAAAKAQPAERKQQTPAS